VGEGPAASDPRGAATSGSALDVLGAALVAVVGIGVRLAFVRAFPTIPFNDFRGHVDFGLRLRDLGLAAPGYSWVQTNAGLPLLLSVLFRIFPANPDNAARVATAVVSGLAGAVPVLLWRPILARRWRLVAGLALALWPGQVLFSGVVAQENWALLPLVALACLGVRAAYLPSRPVRPIAVGLLYAWACALRQELVVVLLPLVLVAAGVAPRRTGRFRALILLLASAGVPLLLLAAERRAATGRFALTTEHGGPSLLGSVVPGAAADGWVDPKPYVAARRPELLRDRKVYRDAATGLAVEEWRRRWRYQLFRTAVSSMRLLGDSDAECLFWSVGAAEALPPERRASGEALAARSGPLLRLELAALTGLFAAAVLLGAHRRDPGILLLALAFLLKLAMQSFVSPVGRLMVPGIALELLTVSLAASRLARIPRRGRALLLGAAVVVAAALLLATPPLLALARRKDEAPWPIRRFPLEIAEAGLAECRVESGRVAEFEWGRGRLTLASASPGLGESTRVTCELPAAHGPLRLKLDGAHAWPGDTIRIGERVEADGRDLFAREIGQPEGAPPVEVPLGDARSVSVEIRVARPGSGWVAGSFVGFQIVPPRRAE